MNVEETSRFGSKKGRKLTSLTKKNYANIREIIQPSRMKRLVGNSHWQINCRRNGLPLPKAQ